MICDELFCIIQIQIYQFVLLLYTNLYTNIHIGTDAIGSKSKKQGIIKNNSNIKKYHIKKKDIEDARCHVSQ
jgi:hypothetical protein